MATTLFFNGIVTSVPGSYSKVDATGLEQVGLGASGIVALLGTAEGGKSVSDIDDAEDFVRHTKPESPREIYRSGNLLEASGMLFEPAKDDDIKAGAQSIVAMKVNPATQSVATLNNAAGNAIDLTSEDYGAFTEQVNVSIATGTNQGKLLTIIFEDITESVDDLGGDDIFTLTYSEAVNTLGWDTMTAQINAGGTLQANGTRAGLGQDTQLDTPLAAPGTLQIKSDSALDITQTVTVLGIAGGVAAKETFVVSGLTPVVGTVTWDAGGPIYAAYDIDLAGDVTVEPSGGGASVMTLGAGNDAIGGFVGKAMFVGGGVVQVVSSAAETGTIVLHGLSTTGASQLHLITCDGTNPVLGTLAAVTAVLTWNGTTTITTPTTSEIAVGDWVRLDSDTQWFQVTVVTTNVSVTIANPDNLTIPTGATARSVTKNVPTWSKLTDLAMGDVAAANTFTYSGKALQSTAAVHNTVQKLADFANARIELGDGFTMTLVTGQTAFDTNDLDVVSAVNIDGVSPGFEANLYAVIYWINTNSALVTAAIATGATGGDLNNTTAPLFLVGGAEGTATTTEWQKALNLLKQVRINSIVPLTSDPAIHAMVDAHCAYMGGIGRSERDAFVGLQNTGQTEVPTKTEAKAQVVDLNTRHIRACPQATTRFNIDGTRTRFQPFFTAAVAAGMQAGSSVGTSLTRKQPNVLAFDQDTSWNPTDDADEMIQGGLLFMENVDGVGRRWVRNVTTHLSSDNLAFIEGSVNEAANYSVFTFRTSLERAVGKKGFAGTVNATAGLAVKELGLLVDEEILVQHRSLGIDLVADVLEVSVEMAPVIPINFVKSTIHLVIAS